MTSKLITLTNQGKEIANTKPLTRNQFNVLNFIMQHIIDHHSPPTCVEICNYFGWNSPNAANDVLNAMQKKGVIKRTKKQGRGIRVLVGQLAWVIDEIETTETTEEKPIWQH